MWADVIGYDGVYEVSNLGRIKSVAREVNTRWGTGRWVESRILKQAYSKKDRVLLASLQSSTKQVGRIVFESFNTSVIFNKDECVMHKNKLLIDNRLVNLEKVTRKKSKKTDLTKSKRTIIATPKNLKKAIESNKLFYDSRTHKVCNICNNELILSVFIHGHNESKPCYNNRMRIKRKTLKESATNRRKK